MKILGEAAAYAKVPAAMQTWARTGRVRKAHLVVVVVMVPGPWCMSMMPVLVVPRPWCMNQLTRICRGKQSFL